MVAKGYSSATLVAQEMAVDLTAPQLDQCADMLEAAEAWIDRQTGRAWAVTSPVVSELHSVYGPAVYLVNKPVTAVSAVTIRSASVGASPTTLTAGTDYELIDATNGVLLLSGYGTPRDVVINTEHTGYDGYLLFVSYTTTTPAPADIQRASTLLAAEWMLARLNPDYQGVESYRIAGSGDEFQVKMASTALEPTGRMSEVLRIVRAREALVIV